MGPWSNKISVQIRDTTEFTPTFSLSALVGGKPGRGFSKRQTGALILVFLVSTTDKINLSYLNDLVVFVMAIWID